MSKINWLKNFFKSSIENILIQLITLGAIIYIINKLIDFLNYSVKIWQVLILLFIILILIYCYNYLISKSVHKFLKYGMACKY